MDNISISFPVPASLPAPEYLLLWHRNFDLVSLVSNALALSLPLIRHICRRIRLRLERSGSSHKIRIPPDLNKPINATENDDDNQPEELNLVATNYCKLNQLVSQIIYLLLLLCQIASVFEVIMVQCETNRIFQNSTMPIVNIGLVTSVLNIVNHLLLYGILFGKYFWFGDVSMMQVESSQLSSKSNIDHRQQHPHCHFSVLLHSIAFVYFFVQVTCTAAKLAIIGVILTGSAQLLIFRPYLLFVTFILQSYFLLKHFAYLIRFSIRHPQRQDFFGLKPVEFRNVKYGRQNSGFLSAVTFFWFIPIIKLGYSKNLTIEDLGLLPENEESYSQYKRFNSQFEKINIQKYKRTFLWRVCWLTYRRSLVIGAGIKILSDLTSLIGPMSIEYILNYISRVQQQQQQHDDGSENFTVSRNESAGILVHVDGTNIQMDFITVEGFFQNAFVVAVIVLIATLLQSTFSNNFNHLVLTEGTHLKTALNCCIYQKALRMPVNNRSMDAGIIANYMALDSSNIFQFFTMMHYLWAVPIKIIVLLALLYRQMGISAICGATIFFLLAPFQYYCSWKISKIQKSQMNISDKRISKTTELFMGIKLLKLMGWELPFANKVEEFRHKELKYLKLEAIFIAINTFTTQASAILVTVVTFGIFRYIENEPLKASTVFTCIALFNQITVPLYIVPLVIPMLISAIVSHGRLVDYFSSPDLIPNTIQWEDRPIIPGEPKSAPVVADNFFHKPLSRSKSWVSGGIPPLPMSCQICDGEFAWYDQWCKNRESTLSRVNLTIPQKKLTIVVGSIGSGKSTLLASLIGETRLVNGELRWYSKNGETTFGYVPSSPWILNVSLQENITLGREPLQVKRYENVIKACCLQADINLMPNGDQTIIGERGLTLSGGQRQRVALARAIYSSAPTLILDDSLSALDPIVGYSVFENAIITLAIKYQKRTVILATHKQEYLSRSDYVVLIESGRVKDHGTLKQVENANRYFSYHRQVIKQRENMERQGHSFEPAKDWKKMARDLSKQGEFRGTIDPEKSRFPQTKRKNVFRQISCDMNSEIPVFLEETMTTNEIETSSTVILKTLSMSRRTPLDRVNSDNSYLQRGHSSGNHQTPVCRMPSNHSFRRLDSHSSNRSHKVIEEEDSKSESTETHSEHTDESSESEIEDESHLFNLEPEIPKFVESPAEKTPMANKNEIPLAVYQAYLKAHTYPRAILAFILIILNQTFRVVSDFWLANWTDNEEQRKNHQSIQVEYYIRIYMILSAVSVAVSLATNLFAQLVAIRAVQKLHNDLLERLVRVPLRFFDKTPIGRIINRFTNDINVIDKILPIAIPVLFRFLFLCLSAIVINIMICPYFLLATIPILIIYYYFQNIYRCTSRQLQRLELSSKSPIISHFNETVDGLVTIRAFCEQQMFVEKFHQLLDANNLCFLMANSAKCFLGIFLDYYGGIILFLATVTSITAALYWNVHSAFVGLSMTYTLLVPVYLNWLVRNLAQTEMNMNSVERIYEYMQLEMEKSCKNGLQLTDAAIPEDWLKNGEIEFRNVTIQYEANQEPIIHDANIRIAPGEKIGICGRTGSGKSSLIGALFRINQICKGKILIDGYDITGICPNKLRSRLAIIPQDLIVFSGTIRDNLDPSKKYTDEQLWKILKEFRLDGNVKFLHEEISNGESRFSSGQRQLLCCARAFLRNSPILIMDESTSLLDRKSEQLVLQQILKSQKTVIVIAHRVLNITDFDKVAVVNEGRIVEFDTPKRLLQNPKSMFYSLYHKRI